MEHRTTPWAWFCIGALIALCVGNICSLLLAVPASLRIQRDLDILPDKPVPPITGMFLFHEPSVIIVTIIYTAIFVLLGLRKGWLAHCFCAFGVTWGLFQLALTTFGLFWASMPLEPTGMPPN